MRSIMASSFPALALTFFCFFHFASLHVFAAAEPGPVIEDGYEVTTVVDGHKIGISPYAVFLKPGSSDLIVLDYSGNAFYTVPFPVSKDGVTKLSGTGDRGYADGEPGSVKFNRPRNFAVDLTGNVYVADKNNNVIRKINSSGVTTTIAGVYNKTGRDDGPMQNATFSNDFELVFVVEKCALLVSDHGNQLVRWINLKAEDCGRDSDSGHGVSAVPIWSVAVGVACIVGFVGGLAARPYILTRDGVRISCFSETWKLCLINLGKLVQILCFVIRSAVVNLSLVCSHLQRLFVRSLSQISLVFRIDDLAPQVSRGEQALLLDSNKVGSSNSSINNSEMMMLSEKYANQLKDLMSFDEILDLINPTDTKMIAKGGDCQEGCEAVLPDGCGNGRIDKMIKTNAMHFAEAAKETTLIDGRSGLVKRR